MAMKIVMSFGVSSEAKDLSSLLKQVWFQFRDKSISHVSITISFANHCTGGSDEAVEAKPKRITRLSDESGKMEMTEIASGKISKTMLESKDVFLVDNAGVALYVWVGKQASKAER